MAVLSSMQEKTDEDVAQAVQRGDVEAYGVLVERYSERMLRYARRFLLNPEDSQDLVQDVFIKVYENIRSFDPSRRFSPWIYRIAHNEFVNAIRKRKREPLSYFDLDTLFPHPIAKETADRDASEQETRRALEKSLAVLDPKYREPLVLYYFEEMSYQEIADVLRIPVATVGVRLNRGKALLKKNYVTHYG
jgi:RNA polymerase sigma-70 factor (ECF subfamily)